MTDTYSCGITMHRPEADLYELLGICQDSFPNNFPNGNIPDFTPDQRYAWKALSDIYYHDLYRRTRSTKALYDAGFFDDGLPKLVGQYKAFSPYFMTTSLAKAEENYYRLVDTKQNYDRYVIMFTTGGMAPIHNGHIAMMEQARTQLEADGTTKVLGGFFAPGHDSYVGKKYNGTAAIPVEHRVAMVELATAESDWLEVDPWAARYMPAEINFTDIYRRLSNYVAQNMIADVDIVYVCGSDNAGFADSGIPCIVVDRTEISSKAIREGDHTHLHPKVAEYLTTYKTKSANTLPYLIRNEEDDAIMIWEHMMPGRAAELTKRRVQLQSAIRLGIAQLFKNHGEDHKVHLLNVSKQRELAAEVIGKRPTISLDPFFQGTFRLDSTRYFAISQAQRKPLYRAARVDFPTMAVQAATLPEGSYVLVEDDSVTGETIMYAQSHLPKGVKVEQVVLLSDFADYPDDSYFDVVDMRDFIVGSEHGGLSVAMNSGYQARVPYALPYVSLRSRAKIPPQAEMELSRIIWQANYRFFAGTHIRVSHTSEGFRRFVTASRWNYDTLMSDLCKWHVEALLENV